MHRRILMGIAVVGGLLSVPIAEAKAICDNGSAPQWVCMSWNYECAPTWIHSCYCCV